MIEWNKAGNASLDDRFQIVRGPKQATYRLVLNAADRAVADRHDIDTQAYGRGAKTLMRTSAERIAEVALDTKNFKLPTHIYLIAWWNGRGYPVCLERTFKARLFYEEGYAFRQLTEIISMPTHHLLVGTWHLAVGDPAHQGWIPMPDTWLPGPDEIAAARAKRLLVAQESDPTLGPVPFGDGNLDDG